MRISTHQRFTNGMVSALAALAIAGGTCTAQTDDIVLAGQIRDFTSEHPDFGLTPGSGGAVTGLLNYYTNMNQPVYLGNGLGLTQDCLDAASRAIAPHLFADSPENTGVFVLGSTVVSENLGVTDSYNTEDGAYDPTTAIGIPPLDPVSSLPVVTAPIFDMAVVKVSTMKYAQTQTWSIAGGDYWCDTFFLGNDSTLEVNGDVVIRCDSSFRIRNGGIIRLMPGATLTLWIGGAFRVENHSVVSVDDWDHTRMQIFNFGTDDMEFDNATEFRGTIVAPNSDVIVTNDAQIFGSVTAAGASVDNTSGIHIAGEFAWVSECFLAGDLQQAAGTLSDGTVDSALSFSTWFNDAPGVNLTDTYQMILSNNGGSYGFSKSNWDPINEELYGNEGGPANRGFTVSLQSIFLNSNCSGMFFEIETGMDAWIFIDNKLVIDLGGTTETARQRIELDRLGLPSNTWHTVRVFIAQRVNGPQDLRIQTTIPMTPPRDIVFKMATHHD